MFDLTSSSSGSDMTVPARPAGPNARTLSMQTPSSLQPVTERNAMLPSGNFAQPRQQTRSASPSLQYTMPSVPLSSSRPSSAGPSTVPRSPCRSMAVEKALKPAKTDRRDGVRPGSVTLPAAPIEKVNLSPLWPSGMPPLTMPRAMPTGLIPDSKANKSEAPT